MQVKIEDLPDGAIVEYRKKWYVKTHNQFNEPCMVLINGHDRCDSSGNNWKTYKVVFNPNIKRNQDPEQWPDMGYN